MYQAGQCVLCIVLNNYLIGQSSASALYEGIVPKMTLLPKQAAIACQSIVDLVQARKGILNTIAARRLSSTWH